MCNMSKKHSKLIRYIFISIATVFIFLAGNIYLKKYYCASDDIPCILDRELERNFDGNVDSSEKSNQILDALSVPDKMDTIKNNRSRV